MIEVSLTTFLLANGHITAMIGDRLHPDSLPEPSGSEGNPAMPALVYQMISTQGSYSHDGDSGLDRERVQFTCWATTPTEASQLRDVLRMVLSGYSGLMGNEKTPGVFLQNQGGNKDPETGLYRKIVDAFIWHQVKL